MTRIWRRSVIAGASLGALAAALMMRIAWLHNAQGEIHDEGTAHWIYWLGIGISWFLPAIVLSGLTIGSVWTILDLIGSRLSVQRERP